MRDVTLPTNTLAGFAVGLVLLCGASSALSAPPVIPADIQASIRTRVNYAYNPGIIVGMVNPDGRTFFSYGQTAYDSGVLPAEHTLYEIGSVTKVFTTTLLAEMVARGEVQLSDTVASLLPESVNVPARNGIPISLEHLATHSSGLPDNPPFAMPDPANPFAAFSVADLYAYLQTYVLPRDPGTQFAYSNLGVGLLGHALARRLNLSYEEALRQRVLQPLGLADTTITASAEQTSRRAPGYSGVVPRPPFRMASLDGAGALLSTVADLLTFLEYELGLRATGLSSVLLDTQTPRFSPSGPNFRIGLGWLLVQSGNIQFIYHDGATMGHRSFVGFNRQAGTGVVVLSNARVNPYADIQDIGLKLLLPQSPLTTIVPPANVSLQGLRSFFGRYLAQDGTWFDIGLLHGHLTAAYSSDQGVGFTLYAQSARQFRMLELGFTGTATFAVAPSGRVTSMNWNQPGYQSNFQKQTLPVQLALEAADGMVQLTLTGNTDTDYVIEVSENLTSWTEIVTRTIWDGPVTEAIQPGAAKRFYRARAVE